ncbi:MAG: hypothetical protein OER88_07130 [Planctomycetota bacterium]|nr:hypothetical protein [Planctomycetota bacterium]
MSAALTKARVQRTTFAAVVAIVFMLFVAFAAAYLERRAVPKEWVRIPVPRIAWLNLIVLAAASAAVEAYRRRGTGVRRAVALATGALFLALQAVAWQHCNAIGAGLSSSAHASFFFVVSGVHGAHVIGGLVALLWPGAPRGLVAGYWHFLGFSWLALLSLLTFL